MRLATVFSGIGAPEQAAKRIYGDNLTTVFACEIDKFARESYLENYTITLNHFHTNIYDVDFTQYHGTVDILVGGSPCQDFSIGGKGAGWNGMRGTLTWEFVRAISEVRPNVFIFENVKGITNKRFSDGLAVFGDKLIELGYTLKTAVLNTKDYGVPQSRNRYYIVGFIDDNVARNFHFAKQRELKRKLKHILEDDVDQKYYLSAERISKFMLLDEHNTIIGRNFIFRPLDDENVAHILTTKQGERITDNFIKVVGKVNGSYDQNRRVYSVNNVSPTINTMGGGDREPKILVKSGIRKLTERECLRLQDFPDDFKIVVSRTQAYKQAGNSMSVNVIEMLMSRIQLAKDMM